ATYASSGTVTTTKLPFPCAVPIRSSITGALSVFVVGVATARNTLIAATFASLDGLCLSALNLPTPGTAPHLSRFEAGLPPIGRRPQTHRTANCPHEKRRIRAGRARLHRSL